MHGQRARDRLPDCVEHVEGEILTVRGERFGSAVLAQRLCIRPPSAQAKAVIRAMLSHIDSDPLQFKPQSASVEQGCGDVGLVLEGPKEEASS